MLFKKNKEIALKNPGEVVSQLHLEHSIFIYKFLIKKRARPEIAEEIIQETFMYLYENSSSIRDWGAIKGWLIKVAFNYYQKYLDKKSTKNEDGKVYIELFENDEVSASYIDESKTYENERYENVECFKKKFIKFEKKYPDEALAIEFDLKELSGREIAMILGRSEAATRTFLKESRKKLKPFLEECR